MALTRKEVAIEFLPLLRVFTDGTVERLIGSPIVSPSLSDPITHVASKDVSITTDISARLFLPEISLEKFPVLVYFHGGGFCLESAFSFFNHRYMNILAAQSKVLVVSVEFRLAPEHLLPIAYEDSWVALQWVCSHSVLDENMGKDQWLGNHGDFSRVYVGGDTTGANIAHNIVMRAGLESLNGAVKILGAFLSQPFFWGSTPIRVEAIAGKNYKAKNLTNLGCNINPFISGHQENMMSRVWKFVYPSAAYGIDNPMINPFSEAAPSLSQLGCSKLLVCIGEKDVPKERGIHYCEEIAKSGWEGKVDLYIAEGGKHGFHIIDPETDIAKRMFTRLESFLK